MKNVFALRALVGWLRATNDYKAVEELRAMMAVAS